MAAPKKTKTIGRPTKFKPEFCDEAMYACLLGATNESLAEKFEVGVATIVLWIRQIPAFSSAIKRGRQGADEKVAGALFKKAIGFEQEETHIAAVPGVGVVKTKFQRKYAPTEVAQIFWLKNRRPDLWRPDTNLQPLGQAPEDAARVLREQLASIDNLTEGKE